ncbi:MAG: MBL fold metallo-hydrolase [Rhodospirillaceae bacterium]|nr:MBL fold metallo-hydrolase [Rhodospirillaceae bacterium]
MRIATPESWYETEAVGDGVTCIREPWVKPFYRCNIWHLRGRERDLLIDSGMGVVSLRAQVRLLAERPLLAVASHTHFDHIGAHHEFAERAVHAAEAAVLARPDRERTVIARYVSDDIFERLPPGWPGAAAYAVTPAPPTRILEEGDVIDLGDRHLEVLHLPGHSPGSIALWERATGILFAGDVVYDGELVDDNPDSSLPDYIASMERLRALPVRVVHAGHCPSFGRDRLLALIDAYRAKRRGAPAR